MEIADEITPRLIDEMNHATGSTERLAAMMGVGKHYVYDGSRPGRILVDGADTAIVDLTDAEKVTAGEQLLKRVSLETGKPVADLRKELTMVSNNSAPKSHSERPFENRKERRARASARGKRP